MLPHNLHHITGKTHTSCFHIFSTTNTSNKKMYPTVKVSDPKCKNLVYLRKIQQIRYKKQIERFSI